MKKLKKKSLKNQNNNLKKREGSKLVVVSLGTNDIKFNSAGDFFDYLGLNNPLDK